MYNYTTVCLICQGLPYVVEQSPRKSRYNKDVTKGKGKNRRSHVSRKRKKSQKSKKSKRKNKIKLKVKKCV